MTNANKETVEQILFGKDRTRLLYPEDNDVPQIVEALEAHYAAKYEAAMQEARIEEIKDFRSNVSGMAAAYSENGHSMDYEACMRSYENDCIAQLKTNPTNYKRKEQTNDN